MNLPRNHLLAPLATLVTLFIANLALAEPLDFLLLLSLAAMLYVVGLLFVLTVWSMRCSLGLLKSSMATFGTAVLVADFSSVLLDLGRKLGVDLDLAVGINYTDVNGTK